MMVYLIERNAMLDSIHNFRIPITEDDLGKFFTVSRDGKRLTLGDYLKLVKSGEVRQLERESVSAGRGNMLSVGETVLEASEIELLIDQYLESMADDEVFEIVGVGSFTKQELREQMVMRTSIGMQIVQMILDDHNFVAEQIKRGNYIER